MKNKYLISALSLIVGLGLGTLTNKELLQSRAEEEPVISTPVFMSANATNHFYNYLNPGGGTAHLMQYRFYITNSQVVSLQSYLSLYISIPYLPQYNDLDYFSMYIYNGNSTNGTPYHNISERLSVGLISMYGVTTYDLPQFVTNNFLKNGFYMGNGLYISLNIPVNYFDAQYMPNMLNGVNLYDKLPATEGEQNAYKQGYNNGYSDGFNDGTTNGYDNGYNVGFDAGVASDFDSFSWLTAIFSGFTAFFSIQFLPGVTIGGVAILVMTLTLLPFLIGLFKGGKD